MPVVKTTSFDDNPGGAASYNVEAVEAHAFDYRITARFNEPAEAVVFLRDVDGSLAQKYNDDSRDVYTGPGRLKIEKPAANTIYDGRIHRAVHNKEARVLSLYTRDWLSQLDDHKQTRDMREDLDGANLRESEAHADPTITKKYLLDAAVATLYSAQADDGGAFTDETAEANNYHPDDAGTDDDMTLMPAVPQVNDAYYFGFESKVAGMGLYISTAGAWVGTNRWEYWDGGAWAALADFTPATQADQDFEVGGLNEFGWTVPGDWATVAVNGVTAYYVRARVQTFTGITTQPLGRIAYAEFYLYDDNMVWDTTPGNPQNFDGMNLVFTTGMAGKKTWKFFPYDFIDSGGAFLVGTIDNVWIDDSQTISFLLNGNYTVELLFKIHLGHNTPSDFYVHNSISKIAVHARYQQASVTGNDSHIRLYNTDDADYTIELHHMEVGDLFHHDTMDVLLDDLEDVVDSEGRAILQFDIERDGGNASLAISEVWIEVTVETEGRSTVVSITETEANRIRVSTALSLPANQVWEAVPYSIVRPAFKHIASDESPGDLVTDSGGEVSLSGPDPLVALTSAANIEHTTGFSLRRYEERSHLEMMIDLAKIDKVAFWMPIGTVGLVWKSTFNDGAPTALTDIDVISWNGGEYNFDPVFNEMHLYESKSGGIQTVYSTADAGPDPGVDSKVRYGVTKSDVIKNTGTTNRADLANLGEVLVERDEDVNLFLSAAIRGLSTLRLGDEVSITSTYLGLTAAKYVITFWEYTHSADTTTIRLHPRNSGKGFVPHALFGDQIRNRVRDLETDRVADTFIDTAPETTV